MLLWIREYKKKTIYDHLYSKEQQGWIISILCWHKTCVIIQTLRQRKQTGQSRCECTTVRPTSEQRDGLCDGMWLTDC